MSADHDASNPPSTRLSSLIAACQSEGSSSEFVIPGVIFSNEHVEHYNPMLEGKPTWVPAEYQAEELERELPSYLASAKHPKVVWIYTHLPDYKRQYLGYIDSGHRMICVNAFCDTTSHPEWREQIVIVFDGGNCYFHLRYDVDLMRFVGFGINSEA